MPVIGLICCQVLEMEFAHILANDADVASVFVLRNLYSADFSSTFEKIRGVTAQDITQPSHEIETCESLNVLVNVLPVGLHSVIKNLEEGIVEAAVTLAPYIDLLMLGYGLCGNALKDVSQNLTFLKVPLIIPMDEDHPIDDCIGMIIGGRNAYYREQCKCAGTMFMTAGWANHWKKDILSQHTGEFGPEIYKRLLENYERVLVLSTEVMTSGQMAGKVAEFADLYGLRTEIAEGTLEVIERTWQHAKNKVWTT